MIILISGSINSGKSTVSKLLVELMPKTAHIEVDRLREFIRCLPLEESIPISLENAAFIAKNFSRIGLNMVIDYPLGEEDYEYLVNNLNATAEAIHMFVLAPDVSVALANRGDRELEPRERERIREQHSNGRHKLKFGEIIDNSNQTPEETANVILGRIGYLGS